MAVKIKDQKSSPSLIISKIPKKWLLPICFILIYGFVMAWDITSYAHTRTIKFNPPIVLHLTPTPTLTPTLTITPTPTKSLKPTIIQAPTIVPTTTNNSIRDNLLAKVNEYRKSLGLSEVRSNSNTCEFAKKRAQEIMGSFNHDGFKNLPYSTYSKVTENIAMNSNYAEVVNQWIASPGHAENMRADTPFVCIENSGNYYALDGWKP